MKIRRPGRQLEAWPARRAYRRRGSQDAGPREAWPVRPAHGRRGLRGRPTGGVACETDAQEACHPYMKHGQTFAYRRRGLSVVRRARTGCMARGSIQKDVRAMTEDVISTTNSISTTVGGAKDCRRGGGGWGETTRLSTCMK